MISCPLLLRIKETTITENDLDSIRVLFCFWLLSGADYDAPLSEAGDYTDKYEAICEMIPKALSVQTRLPERPPVSTKAVYPDVPISSYLDLNDLIDQVVYTFSKIGKTSI